VAEKHTGKSMKDLMKEEAARQEPKKNDTTPRLHDSEAVERHDIEALKRQGIKLSDAKEKHTVWLWPDQSKKLRLYAVEKGKRISAVIEELIDTHL